MVRTAVFALAFCLSAGAFAQAPVVTVQKAACVPTEANVAIDANVAPEVGGASVRLYFRWNEHGAMYYTEMVAEGSGAYWGLPARPEPRNENLEYYVAVVDPTGRTLGKSDTLLSPVRDDCPIQLTPKQVGYANNLVVGETVAAQQGRKVLGFLCDGVVTRINHEGIMRPDEVCRGCVIPFWTKETVGAAALTTGSLVVIEPPPSETSPSRP